ncbi:MAG TPA: M48 family metallopeptidase [Candidatus Polarisedimenticolia bacterium]|jgi:STE24 endopeptidase|nr:M48 family metallopeptidase [Candidatus Polarisedimenticolia bacterium]
MGRGTSRRVLVAGLALWIASTALTPARSETSPAPSVEAPARAAEARFDPLRATEDYLAKVPAADRARSDAYFEGGYWLQLWIFLAGLAVAWIFLRTRLSARIRDRAEALTRSRWLQTLLYSSAYIVLSVVFSFPLSLYADFFREHRYGLSNQTFAAWMKDQVTALGVGLILGAAGLTALYAVFRKAPRRWWIGGAVVTILFVFLTALIGPVYIAPLFNTYTPLSDGDLRDSILSMARANGIPARDVYQFDASRQSKRVSANVSGLWGTMRISLNDNLLNRCTKEEIESVMGHEMGHYVLNHVYKGNLEFAILIFAGFAFIRWTFEALVRKRGGAWGIRGIADVAGLPLLGALFSIFFFLCTPLINTAVRTAEAEADIFGLNASGHPDAEAEVALKLGEYRKLSPSPLEEWIFFDHPSGRNRILMAMRWKAEHLGQAPAAPPP